MADQESIEDRLCKFIRGQQTKPPAPRYGLHPDIDSRKLEIGEKIINLGASENPWEHSGLYQGDIMLYTDDTYQPRAISDRNGLLNSKSYWPKGIVPFYIEEDDFEDEDIKKIMLAIHEYHKQTCIKFQPYKKTDTNWIVVRGNEGGCWSSVGMKNEGQVLHLQNPGCLNQGTIIHEFLHALGFYHQQSASNRDDFVKIHWENISPGKESNFNKYDNHTITDYGIHYDYGSVMHYSGKAFSKNTKPTIEALQPNVTLGQRKGFSDSDLAKLQKMYKESCDLRESSDYSDESDDLYKIFESFFY